MASQAARRRDRHVGEAVSNLRLVEAPPQRTPMTTLVGIEDLVRVRCRVKGGEPAPGP